MLRNFGYWRSRVICTGLCAIICSISLMNTFSWYFILPLVQLLYSLWCELCYSTITHTYAHPFNGPLSRRLGLPGWAGTRKVKPIWILLKQKAVSGSGISWAICKSAPRSRQITTPSPHHSRFLQAGCPSCRAANSIKALKAIIFFNSTISALLRWAMKAAVTETFSCLFQFLLNHSAFQA